jgi:hypothetical protein
MPTSASVTSISSMTKHRDDLSSTAAFSVSIYSIPDTPGKNRCAKHSSTIDLASGSHLSIRKCEDFIESTPSEYLAVRYRDHSEPDEI